MDRVRPNRGGKERVNSFFFFAPLLASITAYCSTYLTSLMETDGEGEKMGQNLPPLIYATPSSPQPTHTQRFVCLSVWTAQKCIHRYTMAQTGPKIRVAGSLLIPQDGTINPPLQQRASKIKAVNLALETTRIHPSPDRKTVWSRQIIMIISNSSSSSSSGGKMTKIHSSNHTESRMGRDMKKKFSVTSFRARQCSSSSLTNFNSRQNTVQCYCCIVRKEKKKKKKRRKFTLHNACDLPSASNYSIV
ncbi:hypothetical protein BDDG_06181 [Blastomyces dermatitidis ATCC 18188]|uniref:Uncharacterized protein n=1 Tax=Ajellomyces dermatitidis (strain ATCC 18188 / CBS 674.68) TaxID=653446 RepID=F2TJ24_AJEDA|nr:hypothetical protein BDDG_06181 [Blastomyces dermatitidis ATCC 18188]